jgi:hypothetical protein
MTVQHRLDCMAADVSTHVDCMVADTDDMQNAGSESKRCSPKLPVTSSSCSPAQALGGVLPCC